MFLLVIHKPCIHCVPGCIGWIPHKTDQVELMDSNDRHFLGFVTISLSEYPMTKTTIGSKFRGNECGFVFLLVRNKTFVGGGV